jgi:cytoplasmic iron level regulating protein YaaA (DUF328/UPF0246 family)
VLILLPPSEGKTAPRRGKPVSLPDLAFPELTDARAAVLEALVALCSTAPGAVDADPAQPLEPVERAAATLGLGSTQLDEVRRNAGLATAPATRADRLYTGVLYDALDLATLDTDARRRASRRLLITSSLFGVVRPQDAIPSYRLSGDVTLPGLGTVAGHWREHLDATMRAAAGTGLVVDLRSSTYAAFWRPGPDLAGRLVTVRVLHEHQGTRKVVSHFNKATKGRLVRALLEDGRDPRTPEAFAKVLADLGWAVEVAEPTARGTQLDVVVSEV